MKIRVRFSKEGRIKFVGHLDLLRLFQRAVKSAGIPIAYSQGYNPHSLLYFAQALSVGITSAGEYIDMHLEEDVDPEWIKEQMNIILPEGLRIQDVYILLADSKTCMTLIDGSSYEIYFEKNVEKEQFIELANTFYNQEEILVTRVSKKKEKIINIKEFIYELAIDENDNNYIINVTLASGSRKNLNAKLFIQSFIDSCKIDLVYSIHRKDLLSLQDGALVSLSKIGV